MMAHDDVISRTCPGQVFHIESYDMSPAELSPEAVETLADELLHLKPGLGFGAYGQAFGLSLHFAMCDRYCTVGQVCGLSLRGAHPL
jgi:hypothetical protein